MFKIIKQSTYDEMCETIAVYDRLHEIDALVCKADRCRSEYRLERSAFASGFMSRKAYAESTSFFCRQYQGISEKLKRYNITVKALI